MSASMDSWIYFPILIVLVVTLVLSIIGLFYWWLKHEQQAVPIKLRFSDYLVYYADENILAFEPVENPRRPPSPNELEYKKETTTDEQ